MSYAGEERRRSNNELLERIAVIETKQEIANNTLGEVHTTLEKLEKQIEHYKGLVGGAIFVVSAVFAAMSYLKEWVFPGK